MRPVLLAATVAAAVALAVVVWWTRGPGSDTAAPTARDPESAELDSRGPCPPQLPEAQDDDGYGFGSEAPADQSPDLPAQDRAWVCRYDPVDEPSEDGGRHLSWERAGGPQEVDPALVPDVVGTVNRLAPPPPDQMCTADLGPRWSVVLATAGGDLTAVVVDDFGCHHVRLSADPWGGAPGETPGEGVPEGVLDGGQALLDLLGLER